MNYGKEQDSKRRLVHMTESRWPNCSKNMTEKCSQRQMLILEHDWKYWQQPTLAIEYDWKIFLKNIFLQRQTLNLNNYLLFGQVQ